MRDHSLSLPVDQKVADAQYMVDDSLPVGDMPDEAQATRGVEGDHTIRGSRGASGLSEGLGDFVNGLVKLNISCCVFFF